MWRPPRPPVTSMINNILIIKLKHIGDVLLASSAFEALHGCFPDARLTALVPRGTEEMLQNNPHVHEVLVFDRAIKKFCLSSIVQQESALLRALRGRKFDVAVDFSDGDRGAILAFLSGARMRLGYKRRKGMWGRDRLFTHVTPHDFRKGVIDAQGDVLRPLGVQGPMPPPRWFPGQEAKRQADALLAKAGVGPQEKMIVFHPTSRWMFKSWDASHCARLADRLSRESEMRVVLTCGPEEKELKKIRQILQGMREPVVDLSGKTTLGALGGVLARAQAFIGVDTAPMHMASALNVPVLALFGPSDPVQWAPRGPRNRVLTQRWACQPCQRDGCMGSKVSQCLTDMSAETVADAVKEWMPSCLGK